MKKGNKHLADFLCHLPVNWVFTVKSNLFSFVARIVTAFTWPPLYAEVVPMGRANHHLFYFSCERLNFPALAKIRSYSVTFVRERFQLLRWFFSSTTHLLSGKKSSLSREEPQVILALPAKEHFAGAPTGSLPAA